VRAEGQARFGADSVTSWHRGRFGYVGWSAGAAVHVVHSSRREPRRRARRFGRTIAAELEALDPAPAQRLAAGLVSLALVPGTDIVCRCRIMISLANSWGR